MAGKLGLAAKLLLGTTLLAGGGGGTWYAINQGVPSIAKYFPAFADADADVESTSEQNVDNAAAANDLDAVASAWGEPETVTPMTSADSSPVARSADVSTLSPSQTTKPATADRYAVAAASVEEVVAPAGPSPIEETTVEDKTEGSTPVDKPADDKSAADKEDTTASSTEPPEPATKVTEVAEAAEDSPVPDDESVARGQEPNEDSELLALAGDKDGSELQPMTGSSTAKNSPTSGSDQAREAFQNPPTGGGRYGAPGAQDRGNSNDGGKPGAVNPFAAGSTPATRPTQGNANIQPIEPLPGPPADASPGELQSMTDAQPLRSNPQTPSASLNNGFSNNRNVGKRSNPNTGMSEFGGSLPSEPNALPGNADIASGNEGAGRPGEKALEGPQRPSLEIQKFAPGEIQVGKPAKFVVRVRNVGTQAADGVMIRDQVPHGTKLVSTTPEAQTAGSDLVWDLGKLSAGEDRTVEMQVMPIAEGEIGSVATVSYSAQASVKTKCTMPQLAIRMTAPAKVMIGQEQRVKIELRNPGSGDATGVMLFENVPQNVKHAAGPTLEFDIGTLKAGETRELELVLMAEKPGKTVNVLSARGDGNLQVQQQVEFEVVAPGLTVDVEGPERRYLERPATYEVSVENPGTAPAHDVRIVTKLPKGLRFVRANNMGEYDAASHAVHWSLAELPEGERGTVELVAMPIEAGPQTLEVESRAKQGLTDQTQRQIVIDGLAAIMFEVKDLEDPIEVGGETGYEIRVVNQGTKAATNVQVAVNLPPGMKLLSAEGETAHRDQGGAIMFEPLAQLAAKSDTVYRIRAQGTAAGDQRIMVQVNTDDIGQPISREESTVVFGDE